MNDNKVEIILDTDIGGDPDDFFALLWLLSQDNIVIKAICCTPGRTSQVRFLSRLLLACKVSNIRLGFPSLRNIKEHHVNDFHFNFLKSVNLSEECSSIEPEPADELLHELFKCNPERLLLTIGPLTNIKQFLKKYHSVEIKKSDISVNGVLYYQLDTEAYTATKKMIHIK